MVCQFSQHKWTINPDFGWSNSHFGERTRAPPYANLSPKWLLKPLVYFWNPFMFDHFLLVSPIFAGEVHHFCWAKPILWRQLVWLCRHSPCKATPVVELKRATPQPMYKDPALEIRAMTLPPKILGQWSASGQPNHQPQDQHTLWLCQNSYWKWPFIVEFPIKNGDFP